MRSYTADEGFSFKRYRRWIVLAVVIIGLLILWGVADSIFGYAWYSVRSTQVAVMFNAGQAYRVVGPGVWTDLRPWQDIRSISIEGVPFVLSDPEVLTKDQQRLGVQVSGTVHRPGLEKADELLRLWPSYSTFYLSDQALSGTPENPDGGLMPRLGKQAAKVCVGDLNFNEAVVGSARDVLRACIEAELDGLANEYGLDVRNVVVPDVVLAEAVRVQMDAITNARFSTQVALQEEQKARAEAARQLAIEQGQILVEQGRIQEKARQDALTAELDRQTLEAQAAVIQAQKDNELLAQQADIRIAEARVQEKARQDAITANLNRQTLEVQRTVIEAEKANQTLTAQRDLEIATINRQSHEQNALAQTAQERTLAEMYTENPSYAQLAQTRAMAGAYGQMDKVIMLPSNVSPYLFLGGEDMGLTLPLEQPTQ